MFYDEINDSVSLSTLLKRDGSYIRSLLKEMPDGRIVATKALDIVYPMNFDERGFAQMVEDIELLACFAVVDTTTKKYAVMKLTSKLRCPVPEIHEFTYQEEKYKVLSYRAGDTIISINQTVQDDKLDYYIYQYFAELARIPWYLSYNDVVTMLDMDYYYLDKQLGEGSAILEMIFSTIARDSNNPKQMYRYTLKNMNDLDKTTPTWIPLRNITLGSVDTLSKVMGSYYDDGLNSALAEPSKKLTDMEVILRS